MDTVSTMPTGEKIALFAGAAAVIAGAVYFLYEESAGDETNQTNDTNAKGAGDYLADSCADLEAFNWAKSDEWVKSKGYADTQAANAWMAETDPANQSSGTAQKAEEAGAVVAGGVFLGPFGALAAGWLWNKYGPPTPPALTTDQQEQVDAKRKAILDKQNECTKWVNELYGKIDEDFRDMISLCAYRIIQNAPVLITDDEVTSFLTKGQQGLPAELLAATSAQWLAYIAKVRAAYAPLPGAPQLSDAELKQCVALFNSLVMDLGSIISFDVKRYGVTRSYSGVAGGSSPNDNVSRPASATSIMHNTIGGATYAMTDAGRLMVVRACFFLLQAFKDGAGSPCFYAAPTIDELHLAASYEIVQVLNWALATYKAQPGHNAAPWTSANCRSTFALNGFTAAETEKYGAIVYNNQQTLFQFAMPGPYVPAQ